MSEKPRKIYFGFTAADRESARQWLEEQSDDGWELVRLKPGYFSRAYFRPRERAGLRYGVDVADNALKSVEVRTAYAAFLAESGWELVAQAGSLAVYRAIPGMDPPPIHTDPGLEQNRFRREVLLPGLLSWLLCPLFLVLLCVGLSQNGPLPPYFFLCRNSLLACLGAALLLLAWMLGGLVLSGMLAQAGQDGFAPLPVDLGPDRAYAAKNGGETCLVLREGNTVVLLESPTDLSDPVFLSQLWTALEWEVQS